MFLKKSLLTVMLAMALTSTAAMATPLPAGAGYEVGFSPNAGSLELVLKGISSAKSQILVAAYSFTSKPIATALLNAHRRGVKVFVVADQKDNSKAYSAVQFLANQGVPVKVNGNYSIFHHKFMVFDGVSVETGSFNYSAAAANKNAENVLLLSNVKPLADNYTREWQRLWNEATPVAKAY
ncbi:phospholipase D family protein [Crenobacter sp. SG2305]|uniref:phospholipase D family nuclease n=1 Tax=Crenobacter oryzisoli TaxID=3056844 RepID=UPI0025AA751F|nr:phospholipase D family protein [Crenobacter sp. SG2305]MDN0082460.1 phospholipase D family protein [Crenobacter sp. SG2305]